MPLTNKRPRPPLTVLQTQADSTAPRYADERASTSSEGLQALQQFLDSLLRHRSFILRMTILGAALGVLAGLFMSPTYTATSQLLVDLRPGGTSDASSVGGGPTQDVAIDTHLTILSSDSYLRRLLPSIRALDESARAPTSGLGSVSRWLWSEPNDNSVIAELKRNLRIGQERRSKIISISYSGPDPKRASEVANVVAQSYIDDLARQKNQDTKRALDLLATQSAEIKNNLTRAEQELSKYNADHAPAVGNPGLEWQVVTLAQQLEALLRKRQELAESRVVAQPDVSILALATIPDRPTSLSSIFLIPPAIITFALLGCFLAFGFSRFDRSLDSVTAATRALGVPCIGILPTVTHETGLQLNHLLHKPNSRYSKMVRSAFASMLASHDPEAKRQRRIVLITSSVPAEGKTTLAWSFACCAAGLGWRTLLLDFQPGGASEEEAINPLRMTASDHPLAGSVKHVSAELNYLLVPTSGGSLFQLLADPNALPLLQHGDDSYDLVIIDAPSLSHEPEAGLLASWADDVLFAVRWRTTSRDAALDALSQLKQSEGLGGPVRDRRIFTVLTRAEPSTEAEPSEIAAVAPALQDNTERKWSANG